MLQEVTKAGGVLEIDSEWYLANQVLPPIARLCGPIEDIDAARIAHHLGAKRTVDTLPLILHVILLQV